MVLYSKLNFHLNRIRCFNVRDDKGNVQYQYLLLPSHRIVLGDIKGTNMCLVLHFFSLLAVNL